MFIVMLGMQGSGKGTQSDLLAKKLGIAHVSTGELLRSMAQEQTPLGKHVKHLIESGTYLSDKEMTEILKHKLPESAILDGYPRTLAQAKILDEIATVDVVINLDLHEDEAVKRMMNRGRADDTPEAIRKRIAQYHAGADEIASYYEAQGKLRVIDGDQSVEKVFLDVVKEIEG